MTSEQMKKIVEKRSPPVTNCDVTPLRSLLDGVMFTPVESPIKVNVTVKDYSRACGLSVEAVLALRECPICGAGVKREVDLSNQRFETFWCDKSSQHIFNLDTESGVAEHVTME